MPSPTPSSLPTPIDRSTASSTRQFLLAAGAILALCLIVGAPTIRSDNYFLGDDFSLVHHLHDLSFARVVRYFSSDWTEGMFGEKYDELRPFLALTYGLDSRLWGATNPLGYHVTNVLFHLINGLLVFGIARSATPRQPGVALIAASVFVILPSHAEVISWISGRVDSLASLFYLGAFFSFVQYRQRQRGAWLAAAVLIFAGGLFAKQSLVTFPILIVAYDLVCGTQGRRFSVRDLVSRSVPYIPFMLLLIGYLVLRYALFGNAVREDLVTVYRVKEFVIRQYFYFVSLLPVAQSASATTKAVVAVLAGLSLSACGLWLVFRFREYEGTIRRVLFFGPIWYAVTILPMVVTYETARHLYVTAAGFSIALASLLLPEGSNGSIPARASRFAVATVIAVLYGVALSQSTAAWIENGVKSQKYTAQLPVLLRQLPPGSIVVIDIPQSSRRAWLWSWGLPFALQTPFVPKDMYADFAIVERPEVYCCPPKRWWADKQVTVSSLWNSPGPREIAVIGPAPTNPGVLVMTTRAVGGPEFKRTVEHDLGKSVESFVARPALVDIRRLARIFFQ